MTEMYWTNRWIRLTISTMEAICTQFNLSYMNHTFLVLYSPQKREIDTFELANGQYTYYRYVQFLARANIIYRLYKRNPACISSSVLVFVWKATGISFNTHAYRRNEPWLEIFNNVVCATSRLTILWILSYRPNRIWSF